MKKLKLCIEELRVDSFGTPPQSGERGTIRAYDTIGDSIVTYEPLSTEDENACPYQFEAETSAYDAKAQAQRHQMRQETDNKVREM
jgi:hypothetical protein